LTRRRALDLEYATTQAVITAAAVMTQASGRVRRDDLDGRPLLC
jgi:hypothetical protein